MATAPHHLRLAGGEPAPQDTKGWGLLAFSGVMLGMLALFNGLDGIAAINRSHVFVGDAQYVYGDLRAWGWAMLGIAIAQGVAVVGIFAGVPLARWFGVVVLVLNAFAQMAFIPSYPVWSVMIIALDVIAVFGLVVYGALPRGEATPTETRTTPSG